MGDEAALKAVHDRYGGPVFAVALSILGDHHSAADAAQLTFVKAWRAAATFDTAQQFGPWIYAIARRTAIDEYRRRRRTVTSDEVDVAVAGPDLSTTWEIFEVRSALEQLPDDERRVMRLHHFEGYTHAQIATHLGIPIGTVKSRSHRAHRRLLELLGHLEES